MLTIDTCLSSLKISNGKPHRPVLLLALAKTVGENPGHSAVFRPTDETLLSNYDLLWRAMGVQGSSNVHYPFFALGKTNFWRLLAKSGREEAMVKADSMRSFRELSDTIEAVEIDPGLMQLLRDPADNKRFVEAVYARFLNRQTAPDEAQLDLFQTKREEESYAGLLLEPEEFVRKVVVKEKESGEIYVRNADFRRIVPRVYEYRCAVTGRGLQYGSSYSVEACHIEPFAHRQLCTLYNGIALSPDIHKLFDAHYLTIDEDYRVVLSPQVREISDSPYYSPLQGRKLWLPVDKALWPRQELLEGHRDTFKG
jgi:putative restriction endonuclease